MLTSSLPDHRSRCARSASPATLLVSFLARRGKTRRLSLLELALLFAQSASFLTLALLVSLGRDLGVALLHFGEDVLEELISLFCGKIKEAFEIDNIN